MPVGINSPAKNLFLLGSSGAQVVSNFFKKIDESASGNYVHETAGIRYKEDDETYVLSGYADRNSPSSEKYGWIEKRQEDGTQDWGVELSSTTGNNTTLQALELDGSNLVAVGKTDNVPWIAKYTDGGVLDWQSTTNSADVEYTGVTVDSNGNYYACGSTPSLSGEAQAFVEKFDSSGNPGWGKSALMVGRDVVLNDIAANSKGEVVAVGYLEDNSQDKGYIVKIDTTTGDVMWDRTLEFHRPVNIEVTAIELDNNDDIYICGNVNSIYGSIIPNREGFIAKYTAEGNLLWQSQVDYDTPGGAQAYYEDITVDNTTKKPTVFGYLRRTLGDEALLISRYDADGGLSWRREIDEGSSFIPRNTSMDGDQSFIYLLFADQADSETYVYGKVSATGNGLGDFEYDDGTGSPLLQYITSSGPNGSSVGEKIGRLSDGSVRNDTTDLITYPFNANKILFDDFATQLTNKRRQMDTAGSFEYSQDVVSQYTTSAAVRPTDFQELNLLGDAIPTDESIVQVSNETKSTTTDGAAGDRLRTVAVGNDKIIVGTPLDDDNGGNSGSAYILDLNGNQLSKITSSDGASNDFFGDAVAVGSNKIVVGAYSATVGSNSTQGAAYIYDLDGTNEIKITASDGAAGDRFGSDVAVGDDTIVVTAPFGDAIYTFDLTGTQLNKISNIVGSSVAVGSNKIVVGVAGDDTNATNAGAVHTYDLDTSNESTIYASDLSGIGAANSFFGSSVAVGNEKIVVGSDAGAAYVYDLDGTNEIKITSDATTNDDFANSVAVGNEKIVVGARFDVDNGFQSGAVYIYDLNGNQLNKISGSDTSGGDLFGYSVAAGNGRVVITSPNDNSQQGAAYIYPVVYSAIDQSGKGNDGVVDGATQNASGYWEFNGTTNYISGSSPILFDNGDSGSIEAWFKTTDTSTPGGAIYSESQPGDNTYWGHVRIHGGKPRFVIDDDNVIPEIEANVTVSDDNWHHVVVTGDGSNYAMYVDGVSYTPTYANGSGYKWFNDTPGLTTYTIGALERASNGNYFNGEIGEVRVYPRALTEAQVSQNYNATRDKYIGVRANTTPPIGDAIVYDNLELNFDFSNGGCIEKSSTVIPGAYETIVDDATTNGAAFGDKQCVATGYGKVVVGARGETNGVYTAGGKAYIYNAYTGALEVTLTPSDISGNDLNFGNAVDICNCSGRIAVSSAAGLYLYDADGTNEVIINSNTTLPIQPGGGNTFGNGLAISGNKVWVADDNVPQGPNYGGTVYCFNAETGAFIYELRPVDKFDNFVRYGARIAANDGVLAIAAESIAHPVTGRSNTGRVYLYDFNGRNEKILEPNDLTTSALFGGLSDVAIGHGMIVVGASRQQRVEDPQKIGSGEVYVFDLEGTFRFSFRPLDDPADEDSDYIAFGESVAISSDRIIVGARAYVGNPGGVAGRAYQFTHTGRQVQGWIGSGSGDASDFGSSVDAEGGVLVIGAGGGSPDLSGRAYIYPLTGTPSGNLINLSSSSYPLIVDGAEFNSAGYFVFDNANNDEIISSQTTVADTGLSGITVEVWANLSSSTVFGSDGSAWLFGEEGRYRIVYGTNYLQWVCATANNSWYTTGTTATTSPNLSILDSWHHIVGVYDGTNVRLVLDGTTQVTSSSAISGNVNTGGNPLMSLMGTDAANVGWGTGSIGQVRVYSRGLTNTEILQNFNATRGKYGV